MSSPTRSGHLHVSAESKAPYDAATLATLREDAAAVVARYPQSRSALLPLLHLVQSVDGYVTGRGIEFCAETLGLTTADVSGVATFYSQFKRHPNGDYTVAVSYTHLEVYKRQALGRRSSAVGQWPASRARPAAYSGRSR